MRNDILTESQDQRVQALVASGRFRSVSEAMHACLWPLKQEEAQLIGIRQGVFEELAQVGAGDFAEGSGDDAIRWAFRTP